MKRKVVMKPARVPQTVVAPDAGAICAGESFIARRGASAQPVIY